MLVKGSVTKPEDAVTPNDVIKARMCWSSSISRMTSRSRASRRFRRRARGLRPVLRAESQPFGASAEMMLSRPMAAQAAFSAWLDGVEKIRNYVIIIDFSGCLYGQITMPRQVSSTGEAF